jgi:hypothetical protein
MIEAVGDSPFTHPKAQCGVLLLLASPATGPFFVASPEIAAYPVVRYIRRALSPTTQNMLRKAADLMGEEELAVALKVPRHLLQAWISGHASMPDRKLMMLIDALDKFAGK